MTVFFSFFNRHFGTICKMKSAQSKLNQTSSFLRHFEGKCLVYLTHVLKAGTILDVTFLNNRDARTIAFCSVKAVNY